MVYKPGNEATWAIHVDHRSASLPGAAGKLFLHGCELKKVVAFTAIRRRNSLRS